MKANQVIEQIRKLNRVFLKPENDDPDLKDAIKVVAQVTGAAALLLDKEGIIISSDSGEADKSGPLESIIKEGAVTGDAVLASKAKAAEPVVNEVYNSKGEQSFYYTALPIRSGSKRLASLMLFSPGKELSPEQLILAEVSVSLIGMHIKHETTDQEEEGARNKELAEGAFESLSYSEVEAIREILKNIDNNESVVVASKIADSLGITRSVIVNALRKFESAGIIESRSLGMKGTLIRVKNSHALELVASRSEKMGPF